MEGCRRSHFVLKKAVRSLRSRPQASRRFRFFKLCIQESCWYGMQPVPATLREERHWLAGMSRRKTWRDHTDSHSKQSWGRPQPFGTLTITPGSSPGFLFGPPNSCPGHPEALPSRTKLFATAIPEPGTAAVAHPSALAGATRIRFPGSPS